MDSSPSQLLMDVTDFNPVKMKYPVIATLPCPPCCEYPSFRPGRMYSAGFIRDVS